MQYSPRRNLSDQQSSWAQIWVNSLIEYNRWSLVTSIPAGYYVYLYLDEE
ncbi:hypothetical protein [Psychrobacter sp.]